MRLQLTCTLLGFALIATSLAARPSDHPTPDAPPLKTTVEILSQRYCRDGEKTYTIIFKLRMRFANQTDRKLIVEKSVGLGEYTIFVARDRKALSDGKYEYRLNVDRVFERLPPSKSDTAKPEDPASPGDHFAILAPGESLQSESEFRVNQLGHQRDADDLPDSLHAGAHVMKIYIEVGAFYNYSQELRKRWESFGDLIFGNVVTDPFDFSLLADPKIENCH